eukprot:gene9142-12328_t
MIYSRSFVLAVLCYQIVSGDNSHHNAFISKQLHDLTRFNRRGQVISSNIGDYVKFSCSGSGNGRTCSTKSIDVSQLVTGSTSSVSVVSYLEGIAMYGIINFAGAILVVIVTALFVMYKLFMYIIHQFKWCHPHHQKPRFKHHLRHRISSSLLILFLVVLLIVTLLGHIIGGSQIFSFFTAFPNSPYAVADIITSEAKTIQSTFIIVISTLFVPAILSTNRTLNIALNWNNIRTDLVKANNSVSLLPNIPIISLAVGEIAIASHGISNTIDLIVEDLIVINSSFIEIVQDTRIVYNDLVLIVDVVHNLTRTANETLNELNSLYRIEYLFFGVNGSNSYSSSDTDGIFDSSIHDLKTLGRSSTPGDGIPPKSDFQSAAIGSKASMSRFLTSSLDSKNLGELYLLNNKLYNILESISLLPNYTITAMNLQTISTTTLSLTASNGLLDQLVVSLEKFQSELDNTPDLSEVATNVQNLISSINSLSLANIINHLLIILNYVQLIPPELIILVNEILKIGDVAIPLLPYVEDLLVVQPAQFNRTIYKIPDTADIFRRLNHSVYVGVNTAENVADYLREANDYISNITIFRYLETINATDATLRQYITSVNTTALNFLIDTIQLTSSLSFSNLDTSINDLRDSISQLSPIDPTVISNLYLFQQFRIEFENELVDAVAPIGYIPSSGITVTFAGQYLRLANGVCLLNSTTYCTHSDNCTASGDSCVSIGEYRCAPNDNYPAAGTTSCNYDSDCTSFASTCLADFNRAINLQSNLLALSEDPSAVGYDYTTLFDQLDSLRSAFDSLDSLSSIQDVQNSLQQFEEADVSSYVTQMQQIIDAIDSIDLAYITTTIRQSQDLINSVNYTEVQSLLSNVQDIIDDGQRKLLDAIATVENVQTFLFKPSGIASDLHNLSASHMKFIADTHGMGPLITAFGRSIDNLITGSRNVLRNVTTEGGKIEISSQIKGVADYFDRASGNEHVGYSSISKNGALYFMLQLSNATLNKYTFQANSPLTYSVMSNKNGDSYSDGKYCVTKQCFEVTRNQFEEDPITNDVDLSYGSIIGLTWLPLGCVFLIGIMMMTCELRVKSLKYRQASATCLISCLIFLIPLYLILSGLLVPIGMIMSDSCATATNVLSNYVFAYGDDMCGLLYGDGTLDNCIIKYTKYNISVALDLNSMLAKVLGDEECAHDKNSDAFYQALHTLAIQLRDIAPREANKIINRPELFFTSIRSPVRDIFVDAANATAQSIYYLVEENARSVLTCQKIVSVFADFKRPVCNEGVGAIGWFAAMLYLSGWVMLCLGLPTGLSIQHHYHSLIFEQEFDWNPEHRSDDERDCDPSIEHGLGRTESIASEYFDMPRSDNVLRHDSNNNNNSNTDNNNNNNNLSYQTNDSFDHIEMNSFNNRKDYDDQIVEITIQDRTGSIDEFTTGI